MPGARRRSSCTKDFGRCLRARRRSGLLRWTVRRRVPAAPSARHGRRNDPGRHQRLDSAPAPIRRRAGDVTAGATRYRVANDKEPDGRFRFGRPDYSTLRHLCAGFAGRPAEGLKNQVLVLQFGALRRLGGYISSPAAKPARLRRRRRPSRSGASASGACSRRRRGTGRCSSRGLRPRRDRWPR